ncbi:hypothetical protein JHJ32_19545 [Parapedobacter sp. ISTM3]|uniref:DUF7004 family protein n=1 Tax=Parapedobacter sp. ISTM3 TaxID=2800130 RepID=UPI001116D23E|nr:MULTISPECIES: hypothetical protein [Parapedobacter]MBK1442200.1 hypothetical protein [Parapedobacter sp. ISTM3]
MEFGKGRIDEWCVFLTRADGNRYAPLDREYFSILLAWARKYGADRVYNDFVSIYNRTSNQLDPVCLMLIKKLAARYGEDSEEVELWFTVLYYGMIAEENKRNTKLGKRIKRLGIYQLFYEGLDPAIAADFSKGKTWKQLDKLMLAYGF